MYFTNEEHEKNLEILLLKYGSQANDVQYLSTIYAAALPEIYDCFDDIDAIDTGSAPLFELMEWNEQEGKHVPSAPGLTGSTRRILEFAVSCYNGYPVGMDEVLGSVVSDELFQVLIQIMKIRGRKTN